MNIGIDTRVLMSPIRTGVHEYTYELLDALFKIDTDNQYFLFYNSFNLRTTKEYRRHRGVPPHGGNENTKYEKIRNCVRLWKQENVHYVESRWPNKIFNLMQAFFGWPKLDQQIRNLDVFFSPNLNFTSVSSETKYILTIHDLSFEILPECYSFKRRLWHKIINPRKQCQRADLIIVPSENTKRDVESIYGIDNKKVRVLSLGINEPRTTNHEQVKKKYDLPNKFILFLSTIEPRKNIEGIIEAYKKSSLFVGHCSLVIAGLKGWKNNSIMESIKQTPGVRYVGYVDDKEKFALYELADLFVYPSLYEGFGFPVLEAMAVGTPVITSNRSSLPEVVGKAVCLVNPYNIAELSQSMELVLKEHDLRDILIEKGKARVKMFSWEKAAQEFLSLINK